MKFTYTPPVACGELVKRLPEGDRFRVGIKTLLQSLFAERVSVQPISGLAGDFDECLCERLFLDERDMRRQD